MPYAAGIVFGVVVVAGVSLAVYQHVVQPELERRRQAREEEEQFEQACLASRREYEREERERERQAQSQAGTYGYATSRSDRTNDLARRRRRRHVNPFADEVEMQEVTRRDNGTSNILFDAGPSSRMDHLSDVHETGSSTVQDGKNNNKSIGGDRSEHEQEYNDEDEQLLEIAKSLSLEEFERHEARSNRSAEENDLLNSPRFSDTTSSHGSPALDTYSVIEPNVHSGNVSRRTSRSQSPIVFSEASSSYRSGYDDFHTPPSNVASQHTSTVQEQPFIDWHAVVDTTTTEIPHDQRASSPTPTLRSFTTEGTLVSRPPSPGGIPSPLSNHSRTLSPFSDLGQVPTHASARGSVSDSDSQWSDLGEDSSSEEGDRDVHTPSTGSPLSQQVAAAQSQEQQEQQRHIRQSRERYFNTRQATV